MTADALDQGLRTWHPNITYLDIIDTPQFIESSLVQAIAEFYPNLRSLTLGRPQGNVSQSPFSAISDKSLCCLIDSCPHLDTLALINVTNLSNRFHIHCVHARNLQTLQITQHGIQLTGEGVVDMSGWEQCLESIEIQCRISGVKEEVAEMDEEL
ncbi:hypothetical protein BC936DRAFT_145564 [Jimgerdemannia flammicorona]|nr:hypothetical protein BC936DRAFT_145564 [Jimgerdemannia flammicorona]